MSCNGPALFRLHYLQMHNETSKKSVKEPDAILRNWNSIVVIL